MMVLSDSERISMMRSAILTQSTRVTDRRADGIGVAYTLGPAYMLSRVKRSYAGAREIARQLCISLLCITVMLQSICRHLIDLLHSHPSAETAVIDRACLLVGSLVRYARIDFSTSPIFIKFGTGVQHPS